MTFAVTDCEFDSRTIPDSYIMLRDVKKIPFGASFMQPDMVADMFNDMTIKSNLLWGRVIIDTFNEEIRLSNVSKAALDEIETQITEYMMEEKKKYKEARQG